MQVNKDIKDDEWGKKKRRHNRKRDSGERGCVNHEKGRNYTALDDDTVVAQARGPGATPPILR